MRATAAAAAAMAQSNTIASDRAVPPVMWHVRKQQRAGALGSTSASTTSCEQHATLMGAAYATKPLCIPGGKRTGSIAQNPNTSCGGRSRGGCASQTQAALAAGLRRRQQQDRRLRPLQRRPTSFSSSRQARQARQGLGEAVAAQRGEVAVSVVRRLVVVAVAVALVAVGAVGMAPATQGAVPQTPAAELTTRATNQEMIQGLQRSESTA